MSVENKNNKIIDALAEKAISGDAEAFDELYLASAKTILYHVKNMILDKDSFEDVAQEVALELYLCIGSLKEPKAFRGWLQRIIRNTCVNHNEKYLKTVESTKIANGDEVLAHIISDNIQEEPESRMMDTTSRQSLFELISSLPPIYRETVILRYYDELSYKEIADIVGTNVNTVGANLVKAKMRLKKMLANTIEGGEAEKAQDIVNVRPISVFGAAGIGGAISAGVDKMIPAELANKFAITASANTKGLIIGAGKTATMAGAIHAGPTLGTIGVISLSAVIGITGVGGALAYRHSEQITTERVDAATPPPIAAEQEDTPKASYSGAASIAFENEKGTGNARNITLIRVDETGDKLKSISYVITDADGNAVLKGNGSPVTSGISNLPNGTYEITFTLTNKGGGTAEIDRAFYIDR